MDSYKSIICAGGTLLLSVLILLLTPVLMMAQNATAPGGSRAPEEIMQKITEASKQSLDRQWKFSLSASFDPIAGGGGGLSVVDLPHDFSIGQPRDPGTAGGRSMGYFPGGVGTYEKTLLIPAELEGKNLLLEFEGVYMNALVYFNNSIVARHPYGYTTFHCDVTSYARFGRENTLKVVVNNGTQPNSRWYSGSGIYRHVWLLALDPVHISPWGVFTTTPKVSPESSTVSVATTVENADGSAASVSIRSTLLDADGREVVIKTTDIDVPAEGSAEVSQILTVDGPTLWDVENPYLYFLKSEVIQHGRIRDRRLTAIGIRSISFEAKDGFRLNGVPLLLKGGCVHSDNGILGTAAYDRAEERKVELLKASGFNAVRCAHNPPSPAFLDACDRLGLLVIDEAFDCWRDGKNTNDYSVYFEDWWQRDLEAMVLRDRNHPAVIMWSIGNEIKELTGDSDGYEWARRLAAHVRGLDDTRAVTNALQEVYILESFQGATFDLAVPEAVWNEHSAAFTDGLDVVGINYGRFHYEMDGRNFPDRVIVGSESFPQLAFDYWDDVERLPYVIGDFVWAALDYLGEAGTGTVSYGDEAGLGMGGGQYPWHVAYTGDIDICGFKRPQSYYRDCVWSVAEAPYIAVLKPEHSGKKAAISMWGWPDVVPSWTWPGYEGRPVTLDVYSTDDEVELFVNGKSRGRKPAGKENRYIASFEVVYEAGELTAVGYCRGVESSRTVLKTAGRPVSIRLTPDRHTIGAEYGDLSYVTVEALDAEGNLVSNADFEISFSIRGPGTLLAVGSGDPKTEEMYVGNKRRLYNGRAIAVVRSDGIEGEIVLTAETAGIISSSEIIVAQRNSREQEEATPARRSLQRFSP